MWRAGLAWRCPPRLSRCRSVRPEEAGTGAAPHCAANAAFVPRYSGISPAVTKSPTAVSVPTPHNVTRSSPADAVSTVRSSVTSSISSVSIRMRRATPADRRIKTRTRNSGQSAQGTGLSMTPRSIITVRSALDVVGDQGRGNAVGPAAVRSCTAPCASEARMRRTAGSARICTFIPWCFLFSE